MSKLAFWDRGDLAIITQTKDGVLDVARATDSHPEELTFTTKQPKSLLATLKNTGLPVRSSCLSLYGPKGKITPEITKEGDDGKEYPYAYTAEQLAKFDAKGVIVKEYWRGKAYRPLVMAFLTPSSKPQNKAPFARVNVAEDGGNIKPDPREKAARKPATKRVEVDEE